MGPGDLSQITVVTFYRNKIIERLLFLQQSPKTIQKMVM